jgi:hypothetical protein
MLNELLCRGDEADESDKVGVLGAGSDILNEFMSFRFGPWKRARKGGLRLKLSLSGSFQRDNMTHIHMDQQGMNDGEWVGELCAGRGGGCVCVVISLSGLSKLSCVRTFRCS